MTSYSRAWQCPRSPGMYPWLYPGYDWMCFCMVWGEIGHRMYGCCP